MAGWGVRSRAEEDQNGERGYLSSKVAREASYRVEGNTENAIGDSKQSSNRYTPLVKAGTSYRKSRVESVCRRGPQAARHLQGKVAHLASTGRGRRAEEHGVPGRTRGRHR